MQLSIGQIARKTGVTVETVRFYEREQLIAAPERTASGYRLYPPETIKRLRFIHSAKEAGFSLKDIGELLALRQKPGTSCADIKLQAVQKLEEVSRKIEDLERIRDALVRMIMKCSGTGNLSTCPILEELDEG
jgi:Hg(II)-responsive transcriptional regulator